jgi:hypothetical protein
VVVVEIEWSSGMQRCACGKRSKSAPVAAGDASHDVLKRLFIHHSSHYGVWVCVVLAKLESERCKVPVWPFQEDTQKVQAACGAGEPEFSSVAGVCVGMDML